MKLVLFGAGASMGQGNGISPPIVSELLQALMDFSPESWGQLSSEEQQLFDPDFEAGMDKILSRYSASSRNRITFPLIKEKQFLIDLQWDVAEFFFQFFSKTNSLYEKLLIHAHQARNKVEVQYSSLNYDTLLIQSVNAVNKKFSNAEFSVSFPHGNAAFICEADISKNGVITSPKGKSVEFNPTTHGFLQSSGPIKIVECLEELHKRRRSGSLFPPIICYIHPQKSNLSGANFIQQQQFKFSQQVKKADQIVIIGVRVNPNDLHIWEALRNTQGKILYIGRKRGASEFEDWKKRHNRHDDISMSNCWENSESAVFEFLGL